MACFYGLRTCLPFKGFHTEKLCPEGPAEVDDGLRNCDLGRCNTTNCTTCDELRLEVKRLEEQLREMALTPAKEIPKTEGDCVVCMVQPRRYAFTPCGHRCVCHLCAVGITHMERRCPICRAQVVRILRIVDP